LPGIVVELCRGQCVLVSCTVVKDFR